VYFGSPTLCLKGKDLAASRRFYEALGMQVVEDVPGSRVVLRLGPFRLGVFTFLEENWLNLRGADVSAVCEALRGRGEAPEGKLERYKTGEQGANFDGECWSTRDPGGNVVFFDTNASERGEAAVQSRVSQLLRDTEQELVRIGASAACVGAFRREIVAKYGAE